MKLRFDARARKTCAWVFLAAATVGGPSPDAAAPPLFAQGGGTTLYVNAETGDDDCFDGLSPRAEDCAVTPPCTFPQCPGPFKTITKALQAIAANPSIGSGPPYTVRIAARWYDGPPGQPWVYGAHTAPGTPANYSGESFPLRVPSRTLLMADGANSEMAPGGAAIRVILEGPLTCTTPPCPDTIEFTAGGEDYFTTEGGLDGSEIAGRGIEVRGGGRSVVLRADGLLPTQWPQIPPPPPPLPVGPAMSIRLDQVWFSGAAGSGSAAAYDLDAHILHGGIATFSVSNCKFTTDTTYTAPLPPFNFLGSPFHTGAALIHVFSGASQESERPILQPTFANNEVSVVSVGGVVPDVAWGMVIEPQQDTADAFVRVSGLKLDGAATATAGGIVAGIEFASNSGNPNANVPRFDLTSSEILRCAVHGVAVATGAAGPPTTTRVTISGNAIDGNGVRPDITALPSGSTHTHYPGSGVHLVRRNTGSWFIGSINANTITGNRTGIGFASNSLLPFLAIPPSQPQDLTIAGNGISGQNLSPSAFPPIFASDGVGVILGDDFLFGPAALTLPGLNLFVEANRIFENARHGVWIVMHSSGSNITPVLRNDRIYGNGTSAAAVPLGDGVRIELMPTATSGTLAPTLVNETSWGNANGYGLNNVAGIGSAISRPVLWNSIVYSNGGTPVPGAGGVDLFGFDFAPQATGGEVSFSDFCGFPWAVACGTVPSSTPTSSAVGFCINDDPVFLPPAAPNLVPTCGGGTSPPNCVCQSPCIDGASATGPGPGIMPLNDANGDPRVVDLTGTGSAGGADMGAIEKQICIP